MPHLICANTECHKPFFSKHSTAMFCSRHYSGSRSREHLRGIHKPRKVTDENAIKLLQESGKKLGKTPSKREFARHALGFSSRVFVDRLGSYQQAVILAGMEPNRQILLKMLENDRDVVSNTLRYRILKRDHFRCQYCGGTPQEGYLLNVDHRIPRRKGGQTEESNLITACWIWNSGKSDQF